MSNRRSPLRWLILVAPTAMSMACGGSDNLEAPPPAASTTLAVSASSLTLAVSGNARVFTVTNTGANPAQNVGVSVSQALPVGTALTGNTCSNLAAAASCSITVTPGATASAAPGDLNPTPAVLAIAGSNTNTLNVDVQVIGQGSVHQGGYVFAIDDSTPNSGSIGGKVAGLSDVSAAAPWSTDAAGTATAVDVPASTSLTDGPANTNAIVAAMPLGVPFHAAGLCFGSSAQGYSDWYLPAVCELQGTGVVCPVASDTMQSLVDNGIGAFGANYWSSTQFNAVAAVGHTTAGGGFPANLNKVLALGVRCARRFQP